MKSAEVALIVDRESFQEICLWREGLSCLNAQYCHHYVSSTQSRKLTLMHPAHQKLIIYYIFNNSLKDNT